MDPELGIDPVEGRRCLPSSQSTPSSQPAGLGEGMVP